MRKLFLLAVFLLTCAVPKPRPEVSLPDPEGGVPEPLDAGSCCPYVNHYDCIDTAGEYSITCPTREP